MDVTVVARGYGHIIQDGDSTIFTSSQAMSNCVIDLSKMVNAMATDISRITNIPVQEVIGDYAEELELDVMTAAYNAVLRSHGCEVFSPPTRVILEDCIAKED